MPAHQLNQIITDTPKIMVVDGSKLVRRLISDVLHRELPEAEIIACDDIAQASQALEAGPVHLVTTALVLPDGDGLHLAQKVRESRQQTYVPVIVVSGDTQQHLEQRRFTSFVTDYFDKSLGFKALAAFIRGYIQPEPVPGATVLYVEDSRVAAMVVKRVLAKNALNVIHVLTAEEAIKLLDTHERGEGPDIELVLSDVVLKGELSGHDVLNHVRNHLHHDKQRLPVLMMTGDDNPQNQSALLHAGANDLLQKPTDEHLLVVKVLFHLHLTRLENNAVS